MNLCEVSAVENCSTWMVLQQRTRYRGVYSLISRTVTVVLVVAERRRRLEIGEQFW